MAHHKQAKKIESRRPILSLMGPAIIDPTTDPAASALRDSSGLVEEVVVLFGTNDSRHARNIKTEQHSTYCSDERYKVGIVNLGERNATHCAH